MKKISFILIAIIIALTGCKNKNENVYKIGIMFPLTGNAAETCINGKKAIELCVDEWNKKGGVLGRKIELVAYDTKNEAKEGITVANKFAQIDKPNMVVNTISSITLNSQPIFEKNKIIQMSFVGTDMLFAANPQYTLRNYLTSKQTSNAVVNSIKNDFKSNEFKFFYPNTEFGRSVQEYINSSAAKQDIVISNQTIYEETELTYKNTILKANLSDSDIVYVMGNSSALGRMIRQLRDSGFKGVIIGSEDVVSTSTLNVIQNRTENLYYISLTFSPDITNLKTKFKEIYSENISDLAILAYNGVDLFLNFLQENKLIESDDVMKAINGFEYEKYMGKNSVSDNEIIYKFDIKKFDR